MSRITAGQQRKFYLKPGDTITMEYDAMGKMLASISEAKNASFTHEFLDNKTIKITAIEGLHFTYTCFPKDLAESRELQFRQKE